jgi:hypothetical protein
MMAKKNVQNEFPPGWDEERVKSVIAHYEGQSDEEAAAEDEAVFSGEDHILMEVPADLAPTIRELIAKHQLDENVETR